MFPLLFCPGLLPHPLAVAHYAFKKLVVNRKKRAQKNIRTLMTDWGLLYLCVTKITLKEKE